MRAFKVFRASKLREFVVFTVALDVLCGCSFVLRFSSLKEFMLLRFEGFEGVSVVLDLGNGYRDGFVDLGRLKGVWYYFHFKGAASFGGTADGQNPAVP